MDGGLPGGDADGYDGSHGYANGYIATDGDVGRDTDGYGIAHAACAHRDADHGLDTDIDAAGDPTPSA